MSLAVQTVLFETGLAIFGMPSLAKWILGQLHLRVPGRADAVSTASPPVDETGTHYLSERAFTLGTLRFLPKLSRS